MERMASDLCAVTSLQRGPIRSRHCFCERVRQTDIGAASYDRSRGVP
jgi:hypothetical protein